jgi:hypothetical protein
LTLRGVGCSQGWATNAVKLAVVFGGVRGHAPGTKVLRFTTPVSASQTIGYGQSALEAPQ